MAAEPGKKKFTASPFRVEIVEVLRMTWTKPFDENEDAEASGHALLLGPSHEDVIYALSTVDTIHATEEVEHDGWSHYDVLIAGHGEWVVIPAPHPDFAVSREPLIGEVFEAEEAILLVTPTSVQRIEGEYAQKCLAGKHGSTIWPLEEGLRDCAFEDVMALLLGPAYGYDLDGASGRALIEELTAACLRETFVRASKDIIAHIAMRVHLVLWRQKRRESATETE